MRHSRGNPSPTRASSFAQAIRDVSCERGFSLVSPQPFATRPPVASPPRVPTFLMAVPDAEISRTKSPFP